MRDCCSSCNTDVQSAPLQQSIADHVPQFSLKTCSGRQLFGTCILPGISRFRDVPAFFEYSITPAFFYDLLFSRHSAIRPSESPVPVTAGNTPLDGMDSMLSAEAVSSATVLHVKAEQACAEQSSAQASLYICI